MVTFIGDKEAYSVEDLPKLVPEAQLFVHWERAGLGGEEVEKLALTLP